MKFIYSLTIYVVKRGTFLTLKAKSIKAILSIIMAIDNKPTPFGKPMREHWTFSPDYRPINNGQFPFRLNTILADVQT